MWSCHINDPKKRKKILDKTLPQSGFWKPIEEAKISLAMPARVLLKMAWCLIKHYPFADLFRCIF